MRRTFLTTIPPKLCAMNTTGLPFSSTDCRSPSSRSSSMLAASSISVTDLLNAVSESYPYDIILLLMPESLSCLGRKSRSHSLSDAPIHVCFQCPPKPCTATMLRDLAAAVGHSRGERLTLPPPSPRKDSRGGQRDRCALLSPRYWC